MNEYLEVAFAQKRQVIVVVHLLPRTEVRLGDVINTNFGFEFAGVVTPAGYADGDDVGVSPIVQEGVCIVDGTIHRIFVDVIEVWLVSDGTIGNLSVWAELC